MISIIVCSIDPQKAAALRKNVEATIGVAFELIAVDNRDTGNGICHVYNEAATRAQYDTLCFLHEDIEFVTQNWGQVIASKASDEHCGVIGFAGSTVKLQRTTAWNTARRYMRCNYIQYMRGRDHLKSVNPENKEFSRVVTLDGMALCMHRRVWQSIRFDEKRLTGFHCYDLDITIAAAAKGFANYVCHTVLLKHYSTGAYSKGWYEAMELLHAKWHDTLPLYAFDPSAAERERAEREGEAEAMRILMQKGLFELCGRSEVLDYLRRYPLRIGAWRLLFQYHKYLHRAARKRTQALR